MGLEQIAVHMEQNQDADLARQALDYQRRPAYEQVLNKESGLGQFLAQKGLELVNYLVDSTSSECQAGGNPTKVPGLDYEFNRVYEWQKNKHWKHIHLKDFQKSLKRRDGDFYQVFNNPTIYEGIGKYLKHQDIKVGYVAFSDRDKSEVAVTIQSEGKWFLAFMPINQSTYKALVESNLHD